MYAGGAGGSGGYRYAPKQNIAGAEYSNMKIELQSYPTLGRAFGGGVYMCVQRYLKQFYWLILIDLAKIKLSYIIMFILRPDLCGLIYA